MNFKKFTAFIISAVLFSSLLLTSCEKKSGLSVGKYEVPYDVLRYLSVNARGDVEKNYGDGVWTSTNSEAAKEELEKEVFGYLSELYAIISLAEKYELESDSSVVKERFEAEKKLYMDNLGGEKEFEEALEKQSLSEDAYEFITVNTILQEETYYALTSEKIADDSRESLTKVFLNGAAARIKQLVIPINADNAEKTANDAASRAAEGENFENLIEEYRELRMQNASEYVNENAVIFRGLVHKELEETAFELETEQTSGVIKTDSGYVVIKKYPLDEEFVSSHFDEMKENYMQSLMYTELEKEKESLEIKKNGDFSKLELYKID